jgi:hypothetical protein
MRIASRRVWFAGSERDENGHLRAGWIQQFFLELAELGGDSEHVGLYFLDLLVEALHLLAIGALGPARTAPEQDQQAKQ